MKINFYTFFISAFIIIIISYLCLYRKLILSKLCCYIKSTKKGVFVIVALFYFLISIILYVINNFSFSNMHKISSDHLLSIIILTLIGILLANIIKCLTTKYTCCEKPEQSETQAECDFFTFSHPDFVNLSEKEKRFIYHLYKEEKNRIFLQLILNFAIGFIVTAFAIIMLKLHKISINNTAALNITNLIITSVLGILALFFPLNLAINNFALTKKNFFLSYFLNTNKPNLFLTITLDLEKKSQYALILIFASTFLGIVLAILLSQ